MKLLPVLLVSLSLNLFVAAALVWRPDATKTFLRDAFAPAQPPAAPARLAAAPKAPAESRATAESTVFADIDWTKLAPPDFPAVSKRLTELGVPAETARSFMAILILKHFNERRRALTPRPDPMEYWRNQHQRPDAEQFAAMRELDREAKRVMRELVGPDFDLDEDSTTERRRYGDLAPEKIANLKRILADYSDLEEQLFADGRDRSTPDGRARSELLAKEKRADIERLLTTEELLDYDLRNSTGAHRLRSKFGAFEPTEAEFRALYPYFKSVEEPRSAPGRFNPAEMRRLREQNERQTEAELRRVLGEGRFAQWQEANDHSLHETRTFVASLNLPPAVVPQVLAIQKEFQPQIQGTERSRDLTPDQRDAKLSTLAVEARTALIRVLGAEGFEAYKRRGGGWLGMALNRAPPTPTPASP